MERNQDTEQAILRAATTVFLDKGYDGTRMQEIADEAAINKALLHYYFRSKERLYVAVFSREMGRFLQELIASVMDIDDAHRFFRRFVENYTDAIRQRPQLVRFILWELQTGGDRLAETMRGVFESVGQRRMPLLPKVEAFMDSGQIRRQDPHHLVINLLGMCVYPFIAQPLLSRIMPDLAMTTPDYFAARKSITFDWVWHSVRPDGPDGPPDTPEDPS